MEAPETIKNSPTPRCEKYSRIAAYSLVLCLCLFAGFGVTISSGLLHPNKHRPLCDCIVLICILLPIIAFIFGIMALWKGRNGGHSPKGKRLARLCSIGSGAILLVMLASIILPNHRHPATDGLLCINELKMELMALAVYHEDYGTYPLETEWESAVNQVFPQEDRQKDLSCLEKLCPGHHHIYWKPDESKLASGANPLFLADAEPYHKGKHNVIYLNGHVDCLTPDEFKALCVTPSNPRTLLKIIYVETGFGGPTEKYTIDFDVEKITYEYSRTARDIGAEGYQKREVPLEEVRKIKASLANFTAGNWENNYPNPPGGISDGTQWRLEIVYSNGSSRNITGSNVWPRDFNRLGLEEIKKKSIKSKE